MSAVLVTGGSGFLASYCILQLLAEGHRVRTTVRNLQREADVRSMLKTAGADVTGCRSSRPISKRRRLVPSRHRLRIRAARRSPIPVAVPKNEDELIVRRAKARCACCALRATPG